MPPMPVDVYVNMKDEDLKAIYAYLKTITPIRNAVRAGLDAGSGAGTSQEVGRGRHGSSPCRVIERIVRPGAIGPRRTPARRPRW